MKRCNSLFVNKHFSYEYFLFYVNNTEIIDHFLIQFHVFAHLDMCLSTSGKPRSEVLKMGMLIILGIFFSS